MVSAQPTVVVLAPDSFKGSAGAAEVCAALARGLRGAIADIEVRACPMADGGEGTLLAVLSQGGVLHETSVTGASGQVRAARYATLERADGVAAVLESAEVVGLTDPVAMAVSVSQRSTLGLGELLVALLDRGLRQFLIGLGGTSTNDGGAGLLSALGVRFLDAAGHRVTPSPAGLLALESVDASALDPRLAESTLTILSDVENPLCGADGATAVFGAQKGVSVAEVRGVDACLERYAELVEAEFGRRAAESSGAGAAGGVGFALQLLGGVVRSGADVIADLVGLDRALVGAHWAITGEGRSDAQTLLGKAPSVVAKRARAAGVPVTLLSGAVDSSALPALNRVFAGCFGLPSGPMSLAASIERTDSLLAERAEELALLWQAARAT